MLMEDMTVGHYLVESTGALVELDKVKLSGRVPGQNGVISWAGNSLAIITGRIMFIFLCCTQCLSYNLHTLGDFSVRIWDIDTSDNYLLSTTPTSKNIESSQFSTNRTMSENIITSPSSISTNSISGQQKKQQTSTMEVFTCINYCSDNQTLCAGTNQGNLYTWKRRNYFNNNSALTDVENMWQLNNISVVRGAIKQCIWGICDSYQPCIMVNCIANAYILKVSYDIIFINYYTVRIKSVHHYAFSYILRGIEL